MNNTEIKNPKKSKHTRRVDWSKWEHLLGTIPDEKVAELAGCTRENVVKKRRFFSKKKACYMSEEFKNALPYFHVLGTKCSHASIAKFWGVSRQAVQQARTRWKKRKFVWPSPPPWSEKEQLFLLDKGCAEAKKIMKWRGTEEIINKYLEMSGGFV